MRGDLGAAERRLARRAAMRIADLGRDVGALNEGSALRAQPFAEHDLARSAAIGVCGIEPPETDAPGVIAGARECSTQRELVAIVTIAIIVMMPPPVSATGIGVAVAPI